MSQTTSQVLKWSKDTFCQKRNDFELKNEVFLMKTKKNKKFLSKTYFQNPLEMGKCTRPYTQMNGHMCPYELAHMGK